MPEAMEEDDFPTLTSPPMPYPCLPDRNRWGLLIGCLVALGLTVVSPRSRVVHASSLRNSAIVQAVSTARPAVVNIHGRKMLPAEYDIEGTTDVGHQVNGMGSGIIIDERGYIITNYHVVEGVKRIRASTRGRYHRGRRSGGKRSENRSGHHQDCRTKTRFP